MKCNKKRSHEAESEVSLLSCYSKLLKSSGGSQLVIKGMPSSLWWVHRIPKESRLRIFTNTVFLNVVLVHAPTRVLTAYSHTTRSQRLPNYVVRGWVVQYGRETLVEIKKNEGGLTVTVFSVQSLHVFF